MSGSDVILLKLKYLKGKASQRLKIKIKKEINERVNELSFKGHFSMSRQLMIIKPLKFIKITNILIPKKANNLGIL